MRRRRGSPGASITMLDLFSVATGGSLLLVVAMSTVLVIPPTEPVRFEGR